MTIGTGMASAGGNRTNAIFVALGDSYAAGEGLGDFEAGTDVAKGARRNMCHRSAEDAYAVKRKAGKALVRPAVKPADRSFWACSGATTKTMRTDVGGLAVRNEDFRYDQPKQVAATVGRATRWISISAGGNDVAFADLVKACLIAFSTALPRHVLRVPGAPASCAGQLADSRAQLEGPLGDDLHRVYRRLLDAAPQAKLVVVGYPRVFPDDLSGGKPLDILTASERADAGIPPDAQRLCRTNARYGTYWLGVTDAHARELTAFTQDLNRAALQQVGALAAGGYAGRITFANTWDTSVPHNCTGDTIDPSVNGVRLAKPGSGAAACPPCAISEASFHPTRAGQDRFAAVVEQAFEGGLASLGGRWSIAGQEGVELPGQPILYAGGQGQVTVTTGIDGEVPNWLTLAAGPGSITLGGVPDTGGPGTST